MMSRGPVWTMLLTCTLWGLGGALAIARPDGATRPSSRSLLPWASAPELLMGQAPAAETETEAAAAVARPTLSLGSSGPLVVQIQLLLQEQGHYRGPIDGDFSGNTAAAVKAFQAQAGLEQTGAVDSATWGPLTGEATAETPVDVAAEDVVEPSAGEAEVSGAVEPVQAPGNGAPPRSWVIAAALLGLGAGSFGLWKILSVPRPTGQRSQPSVPAESGAPLDSPSVAPLPNGPLPPDAIAVPGTISLSQPHTAEPDQAKVDAAVAQALREEQRRQEGYATAPPTSTDPAAGPTAASSPPPLTPPPPPSEITRHQPLNLAQSGSDSSTTRLARVDIVELLVTDLQNVDPAKRRKAIWELGQRADSRAIQPLVNLMASSDSRQRSLILAALSEIGTQTLKPMKQALAMSLQDENAEVRKNAIRDLTRIYDLVAQISYLLNAAVEDPDPDVQETARWALGQLNRIRSNAGLEGSQAQQLLQQSVSPPESFSDEVAFKPAKTPTPKNGREPH